MTRRKTNRIPAKMVQWIDARKRYRLSHSQVQMARELGLNPKHLGSIANHDQEHWKRPLPQFIEALYRDRFGRDAPEHALSIEESAARRAQRTAEMKRAKNARAD